MKVIRYESTGRPEDVLQVVEQESRPLEPGEVRVKVRAAPIHPSDLLQVSGEYVSSSKPPAIPGGEGVGEVVEVGEGVTRLSVGQHVMLLGVGGTWREEIVLPASRLTPLPEGGDLEQLSMIAVNPLTAHLLLEQFAELEPGDWIVQSAANSAVGMLVIQMAARRGIKTINVVRRSSLIEELEVKGADVVLVDGEDLSSRVLAAVGDAPIKLAIDAVGGATFPKLLEVLGNGGTLVSYGVLSMQPSTINPGSLIGKDLEIRGFWLAKWFQTVTESEMQRAIGDVISLIMRGEIEVEIDSRFPLERIHEAVARAAASGRSGKVLLVPASA